MAYTINKTDGTQLVVLQDGTLDTTTSLGLVGRNYVGYGEIQNENFLALLENFANEFPPTRPIAGQIWYNSQDYTTNIYTANGWTPIGAAQISSTQPASSPGSLWFNSDTSQLLLFDGNVWKDVGPEAVEGFGSTRLLGRAVKSDTGVSYATLVVVVNDEVQAIISNDSFTIDPANPITGFVSISKGINISNASVLKGYLEGEAESAVRFSTPRKINGVNFDGQADITIKSSTTNKLIVGDYLSGNDFDGSSQVTLSVDADSLNYIGKVVVRDTNGDFAAGTITAETAFVGNLTGNVTASTGTSTFNIIQANSFVGATLTGNAFTASRLYTPRSINGVPFDGSANVTVPAAAETLTGTSLNGSISSSSLTGVGFLNNLNVRSAGIQVGDSNNFKISIDGTISVLKAQTGYGIDAVITDTSFPSSEYRFRYINPTESLANGGQTKATFAPGSDKGANIGHPALRFDQGYIDTVRAETLQVTSIGTASSTNTITVSSNLTVTGDLFVQGTNTTVNSTNLQIVDKEILIAKGSGSAAAANGAGILVDGANAEFKYTNLGGGKWQSNIDLEVVGSNFVGDLIGTASNNINRTGDTMSGYLTLHANPTSAYHAATKQYVDTNAAYQITYGNTQYSTSGYTNQVGSWNDGANYFDVYPPAGKTMANLQAFLPSIAVIHYAGGVDGNDSLRCTWSNLGDRIRVYVQNTEQRSTPAANWIAFWR